MAGEMEIVDLKWSLLIRLFGLSLNQSDW